jgi:hypothetical protein
MPVDSHWVREMNDAYSRLLIRYKHLGQPTIATQPSMTPTVATPPSAENIDAPKPIFRKISYEK